MVLPGADEGPSGSSRRTRIQYPLADGSVIERTCPVSVRTAGTLLPGQQVLVWYDPADPQDVLVYGRDGRYADRAFVAVGLLFILIGTALAAFGR
jgi:hypothetical protein